MQYLKNIKEQLALINSIVEKIQSTGKMSSIERDILLDKLAHIYEEILLDKTITADETPQNATKSEVKVEKQQPEQERENQPKPEFSAAMPAKKPVKTVPELRNTSQNIDIDTPNTPIGQKSGGENGNIILAEKYQGKRKFRNEIIAEHHQKVDMQSKLQNKPINDLTKAISVNDKFLFIMELFDGDTDRYNLTIQQLNKMTDLNDAIIYLQENFTWEADSQVAMTFIDLLRRKLS